MLKSPPLVATLSDSMRMSPCSWGDIFTWPLRGDRIIGLRQGVAECFTARRLRVSVFSRTAIHAPGGWASDREPAKRFDGRPHHGRVVVDGNFFPKDKSCVSLCTSSLWCLLRSAVAPRTIRRERIVARVVTACQSEIRRAMRDQRGLFA